MQEENRQEDNRQQEISKFTRIAVVCGILGLLTSCCYGGIIGIIGLVYGAFAVKEDLAGKRYAIVGMVASALAIMITAGTVHMSSSMLKDPDYRRQMEQVMREWKLDGSMLGLNTNEEQPFVTEAASGTAISGAAISEAAVSAATEVSGKEDDGVLTENTVLSGAGIIGEEGE